MSRLRRGYSESLRERAARQQRSEVSGQPAEPPSRLCLSSIEIAAGRMSDCFKQSALM